MELHLTTLGRVQITLGDEPVGRALNAKTLALLIYLAVTAELHSREHLANLLWSEMPEQEAQTNLRKALSLLRPIAEPYLVIEKSTVAFDRSQPYWLDVEQLHAPADRRQQTDPSAVSRQASVAHLYRGDFLATLSVKNAPEFEVWVLEQRERYRLLVVNLLEEEIQVSQKVGDTEAERDTLERLLMLDTWNERAHRQKMRLLAQRGEKLQALAQYQSLSKILNQEFGIVPAPETTTLYERIRDAIPLGVALPIFPTGFIGRTPEQDTLGHWLAKPDTRLITLLGPGGVGKTRLAVQVAKQHATRMLHGAVFVSLQEASTSEEMIRALGSAVQLSFRAAGTPLDQLSEFLHDKELLLVLDAFEQLTAAAPLLGKLLLAARAEILRRCGKCVRPRVMFPPMLPRCSSQARH